MFHGFDRRAAGVLLPLFSLPGPYGSGTLGPEALSFLDFLRDGGQRFWQLLPLNPAGSGASPYQSPSSFAGDPMFLGPDWLREDGLIPESDCASARLDAPDACRFEETAVRREFLLRKAFAAGRERFAAEFSAFQMENRDWLPDYGLFQALSAKYGGYDFSGWDPAVLRREPEALEDAGHRLAAEIEYHEFLQFLFARQWARLRAAAAERGIAFIGDLPIYVAPFSAEVWARPELFRVDERLNPDARSGVPADRFSASGQLWGNPLYRWEAHRADGFRWWRLRARRAAALYDAVRLDHFRGFHSYWEIPANAVSAASGRWREGPGMALVDALRAAAPETGWIAEDLGDLSDGARAFTAESGLPGMRVLADAFVPWDDSPFLPHNCPRNSVIYTSTHDTPTFWEWYSEEAGPEERRFADAYLRLRPEDGICWDAVAGAWAAPSVLAITPLQDLLSLGKDARTNRPATVGGSNWRWRVRPEALNREVSGRLRTLTETYRRL